MKYIITYKEKGHEEKRRVELEEGCNILTFVANNLSSCDGLLMKKIEGDFSINDMGYPLLEEKKDV